MTGAIFSTTSAAHRLGISESAVRALADRGELPCLRMVNGRRVFHEADLDALARRLETQRREAGHGA